MEFTDQDIPICCGECCPGDHYEEGLDAMISHIQKNHKNYSEMEASEFAIKWMESAYDAVDVQNMEHAAYMKEGGKYVDRTDRS